MFIKEQFFIVKSSIENIEVKKENQESKELLDLIRQQNCVIQEENASNNSIIKILVENQAAINQASNEVKNETDQEFQKIKSKRKSINCNRNHVPKAKSNQEITLVNRYETLITKAAKQRTHQAIVDQKYQQIHPVIHSYHPVVQIKTR